MSRFGHHPCHSSLINSSNFWKLLSTIFSALLSIVLLVWLVLRPSKPSFSLQQASIYCLSLSDSSPLTASLLISSVQLTFLASNPNTRLGIYHDVLHVYASYQGQQITDLASFPPFYQDHGEKNLLSASLTGSDLPVTPYFDSELTRDQVAGKLTVGFTVVWRMWKVDTWVSGIYRINVKCLTITDLASFPPFYQDHGEKSLLSASLTRSDIPVTPYFESELARDQVAGKLTVGFTVVGRMRWKVGTWVSGIYRINVKCLMTMEFGSGVADDAIDFSTGKSLLDHAVRRGV